MGTSGYVIMKRIFTFCILLTSPFIVWLNAGAQGTAGFEILRLQMYPRGSALGGALIADAGNIESVFYNPAGLTALPQRMAAAGYMNYLLDIESGYAAYVDPRGKWGTWSATLNYTNYGDFDKRSDTGQDLGSFGASDVVLGVSYARNVRENASIGANGKYVHSSIDNFTGSALAFDLAGQYEPIPGKLRLGAGIFNAGLTTKAYVSRKDDLPLYYRIGIFGIPRDFPAKLYFSMTLFQENADNYVLSRMNGSGFIDFLGEIYYGVGAEFNPVESLFLRISYDTQGLDQRVGTRKDALAGVAGGFGFDLNIATVDFGLASYGELGLVQRFSLSAKF